MDEEDILRARSVSFEEKLLAGAKLFEYACEITRSGIRAQFPDASEERVEEILGERLALARRLESRR
jgi:hypothetical protein